MRALVVSIMAALALAAGAFLAVRKPVGPQDFAPVKVMVAGVPLTLDPRLARAPSDLARPALEELDLVFAMPDLAPAGANANAGAWALEKLVFLTLRRVDEKIEPREKPARLYARFLSPAVEAHPAGLILRRFEPGSPYDGEQLYMTAPEGRAFWARCASATGQLPATCLSEARIGGLDLRLRFDPGSLGDWERLTAGVMRLVEGMGR
jgi:hypothetical protein